MSVYFTYTNTVHIPTYVAYKCQKCKAKVATQGYYDVSSSYSTRGAGKKGIQKREEAAKEDLEIQQSSQSLFLRRDVEEIYDDYEHIQCKCPKCGHVKLSRLGDRKVLLSRIVRAVLIAVFAIACFTTFKETAFNISSLLGCIFISVLIAGFIGMVLDSILRIVEKGMMKKVCNEAAPMICSNKHLLMEEAKKKPGLQDVDFSAIENMPDIL